MDPYQKGAFVVGVLFVSFFALVWAISFVRRNRGLMGIGLGCICGAVTFAVLHYFVLWQNGFSAQKHEASRGFGDAVALGVIIGAVVVMVGVALEGVRELVGRLRHRPQ